MAHITFPQEQLAAFCRERHIRRPVEVEEERLVAELELLCFWSIRIWPTRSLLQQHKGLARLNQGGGLPDIDCMRLSGGRLGWADENRDVLRQIPGRYCSQTGHPGLIADDGSRYIGRPDPSVH